MITSDKVEYKDKSLVAEIKVTYSTRAAENLGVETNKGIIKYTKNSDNNIILKSFILEK